MTISPKPLKKQKTARINIVKGKPSIDVSMLSATSKKYYEEVILVNKECFKCKSAISGYGLIAAQTIKKGQVIVEYWGTRIHPDVFEKASKSQREEHRNLEYAIHTINRTVYINADKPECLARYANNSCEPNAELVTEILTDKNGNIVEVIAIRAARDIWLFEEITVSYDWEISKDDTIVICECLSNECKGFIGTMKQFKPKVKQDPVVHVQKSDGKSVEVDPSSPKDQIEVDYTYYSDS